MPMRVDEPRSNHLSARVNHLLCLGTASLQSPDRHNAVIDNADIAMPTLGPRAINYPAISNQYVERWYRFRLRHCLFQIDAMIRQPRLPEKLLQPIITELINQVKSC